MENEASPDESAELGKKIMQWVADMPALEDLHKMFISMVVVSTTENGGEVDPQVFEAVARWAQMLCQNLEMMMLFRAGHLIARADEDGDMVVDFSPEAAKIIERSHQNASDN